MASKDDSFWAVAVEIPLNSSDLRTSTNIKEAMDYGYKLEKLVEKESSGSGAGFGFRDMSWYFTTEKEAEEFHKKLVHVISSSSPPPGIQTSRFFVPAWTIKKLRLSLRLERNN